MDALFNRHIVVWKKITPNMFGAKKISFSSLFHRIIITILIIVVYLLPREVVNLYKIFLLMSITNMWWLLALYPIITWYIYIYMHWQHLRRHGDIIKRTVGGYFTVQGRADDTMNIGGVKVPHIALPVIWSFENYPNICCGLTRGRKQTYKHYIKLDVDLHDVQKYVIIL